MSEIKIYETHSMEETRELGRQMGTAAGPGDVLTLSGDLGVGKTVFTKGFALGIGVTEAVSSPTFTIVRNIIPADFPSITSMSIALEIRRRWMKSDSTIMSMETGCP